MLIQDFIIIPKKSQSEKKKKKSKIPQFTTLRNWENSRREKEEREISSSSFSPFLQKSNLQTQNIFFFVSLKKGKLIWGERRTWQKCRCVTSTAPNWVQMKRESWSETLLFLLKLLPKKATPFSSSLRGLLVFIFVLV